MGLNRPKRLNALPGLMSNKEEALAASAENSCRSIRNRNEVVVMGNLSRLPRTQRQTLEEVAAILAVASRLAKERGAKVPVGNILKDYHNGKIIRVRII